MNDTHDRSNEFKTLTYVRRDWTLNSAALKVSLSETNCSIILSGFNT